MQGKKVRGADDTPNFIIINDKFHKVHPELVSYEMIAHPSDNISFIGYSKSLKCLYVMMANDKSYLYRAVPYEVWQRRYKYDSVKVYYNDVIKGVPFIEVDWTVKEVSPHEVMRYIEEVEYSWTITRGLWATDQPDKIIDPEGLLFQIH